MSSGLEAVQLVVEYINKSCVQYFVCYFNLIARKIILLNKGNTGLYYKLLGVIEDFFNGPSNRILQSCLKFNVPGIMK